MVRAARACQSPTGPNLQDERNKKNLREVIAKDEKAIAGDKAKLRDLGAPVEGDTAPVVTADPNAKPKAEPGVLENNAIKLWAHDVFVERAKTYRYQVVVILTNPYFGHSAAMLPAQAEKLAKTGVMRSATSEWTDPITVDPETYLFFTAATDDDPSANRVASARAEVFQFKWGYWRKGAATLEPGDSVIADIRVPDFAKILAAPPVDPNNPNNPAPPPQPAGPTGGGRGGGKGATGGGFGSPPPDQAPTPNNPTIPAGTPPPMITISVESKQIMLGVGQGTIRETAAKPAKLAPQVYIREPDGEIKIIVPDAERSDPAYTRVSRSADKGLKELTPAADKPRSPLTVPNPNNPNPVDPHPPGGRGG